MKNHNFLLCFILSVLFASCSDGYMTEEPAALHDYRSDTGLIAKFVEVDGLTGTLRVNANKKIMASDYVINRSRMALDGVSEINRSRFLHELNDVNSQLEQLLRQSGDVEAVVYILSDDVHITYMANSNFSLLHQAELLRGRVLARLHFKDNVCAKPQFYSQGGFGINIRPGSDRLLSMISVSIGSKMDDRSGSVLFVVLDSYLPQSFVISPESNETGGIWEVGGSLLNGCCTADETTISVVEL